MNFLRTGVHKDLADSGLEPLSGSEFHQTRTFAELQISTEPEALSVSALWELSTDDSSLDWDYLQVNSRMEAGLNFLRARNSVQSSELYGIRNFTTSETPDELSLEPRITR